VNCWWSGGAGDVVVLCGMVVCCWQLHKDFCGCSEFFLSMKTCGIVKSGYRMVEGYEWQWVCVFAELVLGRTSGDCCGLQSEIHGY